MTTNERAIAERPASPPVRATDFDAATVALPITVPEAVSQWKEYIELTSQLLEPSDYQLTGSQRFKKKSAWRKYARAFNISDVIVEERVERDPQGRPLWAGYLVEATFPNGRKVQGRHECHVTERCCPWSYGEPCDRKGRINNHVCCPKDCSGRRHWSLPGDITATAHTRAKNRAIADMIGAGEISAEEIAPHVAATVANRGKYGICTRHHVPFFKTGGMTRPGHQVVDAKTKKPLLGESGKPLWCNAPSLNEPMPAAMVPASSAPAATEAVPPEEDLGWGVGEQASFPEGGDGDTRPV